MKMSADTLELKFLRYFYDVAGQSMGPSDGDIYWMIQQDFKKKFGGLPDGYDVEAEEAED